MNNIKDVKQLTAIEITSKYRNLRTGRVETWSAKSADGIWTYGREEDVGTLWQVTHLPSGQWTYYPSLPKARRATADGSLLRYLEATHC